MKYILTKEQIGKRLADARINRRLTVREAAKAVGINHSTLVRYENGYMLAPLDTLAMLAELYGVTPAALYAQYDELIELIAMLDSAGPTVVALQPAFQQMLSLLRTGSARSG